MEIGTGKEMYVAYEVECERRQPDDAAEANGFGIHKAGTIYWPSLSNSVMMCEV
jgi:hypothetical protein